MNLSLFKVYYAPSSGTPIDERIELGQVRLNNNNPRFIAHEQAQEFMIQQAHGWLVPFQARVRKMVRSIGHNSRFSASWDENTGIGVERT